MSLQFIKAKPEDADLLAAMNKRLIEDEKHGNKMTLPELAERMEKWLGGDYEAIYLRNEFQTKKVRLEVLVGNPGGKAFWKALGFREYCLTMEMT